jgi:nucleoid-associated protein YgaU
MINNKENLKVVDNMNYNDLNPNNQLPIYNLENIFNVYQDKDEYYFFNLLGTVYFPGDMDKTLYTTYIVQPKDTWQLISYNAYGTTRLWWLICAANQIMDPTILPQMNNVLKIINQNVVRSILNTLINSNG